MTIRAAVVDDADALAAVHVAAWRSAYRGLVPDAKLDALSVDARAERWRAWLHEAETRTLVAEHAGGIGAFVTFSHETGEIGALYVAPGRVRRGLGSALLDAAHAALRAAGHERAQLWVFEANAPARAFYAKHGYGPDGERATHSELGLEAVRLQRTLA